MDPGSKENLRAAGAPPPAPPVPPQLYDAARNKKFGIATVEEIQAQFGANQAELALRVRNDKAARHRKTFDDLVERISAGVRMKALKATLIGTKRSTEEMVRLTGLSSPASQTQIQLGDFGPWAIPDVQLMMGRSQIEVESGAGVQNFEIPSDRTIIEIGQAAARKAGCWGLPQVVSIAAAKKAVETVDLPKAVDWQKKGKLPFPYWKDQGQLADPWQDFHLFSEISEPGHRQDQQAAWCLDLFSRDGEPVTFRERGFIARLADGVVVSAATALGQIRTHVDFVTVSDEGPAEADPTGKRLANLDDIATKLDITPAGLVERLRDQGFLDVHGQSTPLALDAGLTQIVEGGTLFCFEAIKKLLDEPKAEGTEVDQPDASPMETGQAAQMADVSEAEKRPDKSNTPSVETDQAHAMVDVSKADKPHEPAPKVDTDQTNETAVAAVTEAKSDVAADRLLVTVSRRGETGQTARPNGQLVASRNEIDGPSRERFHNETSPGPVDMARLGKEAVKRLEDGIEALLAAESLTGRRAQDGQFVALSGDAMTLRNRISTAAQETTEVVAELKAAVRLWKTFLTNIDKAAARVRELESETVELRRRVREQQAVIDEFERRSDGQAEVIQFRNASVPVEDGSAPVSSH